eukprot:9477613-Pyramimonas_sp.AAC.1
MERPRHRGARGLKLSRNSMQMESVVWPGGLGEQPPRPAALEVWGVTPSFKEPSDRLQALSCAARAMVDRPAMCHADNGRGSFNDW